MEYSCYSKLFFSWFLCVSLLALMGLSADPTSPSLPCMKKLLPCQPYLHSTSPPASCCVPLMEIVEEDGDCLCQIFNDPMLLRSFNLTQDDALKLPKACGFNPDISTCKNGANPPSSPGSPSPSPSTPSNKSRSNSTGDSTAKNSADGMYFYSGGYDFVGLSVALILMFVSAF